MTRGGVGGVARVRSRPGAFCRQIFSDMAPLYLTLTPEEEVEARRRLISEARCRRMAELRVLDRERSRELVARYRASARANKQATQRHSEEARLVAERNEARRQLREIEAQMQEADANGSALAARARAARAAEEERARLRQHERSAARRATEAMDLLRRRKAEEQCARDAEKAQRDYRKHVEDLRARRAALLSRAHDAERALALQREEEQERQNAPRVADKGYTYVEVTADAYTPLMVNRAKSAAKTAFTVERDDEQVSSAPGDAYLAAEAQQKDAASRARELRLREKERRERVRKEQLASIDAVREDRLAEEALELLQRLQGK